MIVSGVDLLPHPPGVLHLHDVLRARADRGHLGLTIPQLQLVVADVVTLQLGSSGGGEGGHWSSL